MSLQDYFKVNRRFYVVAEGLEDSWLIDAVLNAKGSSISIPCEGGARLWRVELPK
jgi:hypothetical protein